MKTCVMRRVEYRIPRTNRLTWGIVLAQGEGLSLLFVEKPNGNLSHALVIATESEAERIYESVNVSDFPLERGDVEQIGEKLQALADGLAKDDFRRIFRLDNDD